MPLYRALVAKELVGKYNYTQKQAAEKLGTTQPAISQYLSSKRGHKGVPDYDEVVSLIEKAAIKIAKSMATTEMTSQEFSESFCDLCKDLKKTK